MSCCRCQLLLALLLLACHLNVGCRRPTSEPSAEAKPAGQDLSQDSEKPVGQEDGPAASLEQLMHEFAAGNTEAVADAIPPAYLDDLDLLIAERVKTIDPSVRKELVDSIARFATVLEEKHELVVQSDRIALEGFAGNWIRGHLRDLSRVASKLAAWPGWADDQALDARSLITAFLTSLHSEPAITQRLSNVRIVDLSRTADTAVVEVHGVKDKPGYELQLVKVQERWVPERLASLWGRLLRNETNTDPATSVAVIRDLSQQLNTVAATLESVSSQAEFDASADRASTLLLATLAQADPLPRKILPNEFVRVEIQGELTEQQKDEVLWSLATATDLPTSTEAYGSDRTEGPGMVADVGPVADLSEFVKRLKTLSVEKIDGDKRTITARLKTP